MSLDPFTDVFLMELARQIPPTETYKLGIELLQYANEVENILLRYAAEDMEVKTFKVSERPFFREKEPAGL